MPVSSYAQPSSKRNSSVNSGTAYHSPRRISARPICALTNGPSAATTEGLETPSTTAAASAEAYCPAAASSAP